MNDNVLKTRDGKPWENSNYIRYKLGEQSNSIWVESQIGSAIGTSISACVGAALSSAYYLSGKVDRTLKKLTIYAAGSLDPESDRVENKMQCLMTILCDRHSHLMQVSCFHFLDLSLFIIPNIRYLSTAAKT